METRALFQKISERMRAEFEESALAIRQAASKGTARENIVLNFLCKHLPTKYGLGAGEIVGRIRGETSCQCDAIVFDKLNGVKLYSDEDVQVFPVDCVYGIIEVKSSLSKTKFIEALDNIKAFKSLAPGGNVAQPLGGGMTMYYARPRPFGMVFAYGLGGNSLDSLLENLREWEKNEPPMHWPNYVCVLETGNILHHGKPFESCLDSDHITRQCRPLALHCGKDSLFQFFCSAHDMCARMSLGPVELRHYDEPSERIGSHIVGIRPLTFVKDGQPPRKVRPTPTMIEKIVSWCRERGPMRYDELLQKRFGSVPVGMEKIAAYKVFLYNPRNLPGLHEITGPPFEITESGARPTQPSLAAMMEFTIDGDNYAVPYDAFDETDFEDIE